MKPSELELMAYVDGEADETLREAIEAEAAEDPEVARWIADQRALRARLKGTYDNVLAEPVPLRLLGAARGRRKTWSWPQWSGAMAASLLLGLLVVRSFTQNDLEPYASIDGRILARGELVRALDTQTGAERGPSARVPLSFVSREGEYCRAFMLDAQPDAGRSLSESGVACRRAGEWVIDTLSPGAVSGREGSGTDSSLGAGTGVDAGDRYRMAAGALDPKIIAAIESRIAGEPLDAAAERVAMQSGWERR